MHELQQIIEELKSQNSKLTTMMIFSIISAIPTLIGILILILFLVTGENIRLKF